MNGGEPIAELNVEREMWKHLMKVMARLDEIETEARELHRCDGARIKETKTKAMELEQRNAVFKTRPIV